MFPSGLRCLNSLFYHESFCDCEDTECKQEDSGYLNNDVCSDERRNDEQDTKNDPENTGYCDEGTVCHSAFVGDGKWPGR